MQNNLIEFQNIHLAYGERVIFQGLNLCLPAGKLIAVLGPSGCGKTSLLRLIGGLLRPDQGRILFKGENLCQFSDKKMQAVRKKMGFMFQSNALFTDLSVFDNIAYPIRVHSHLSESLIRTIVLMKLQMVGLRGAHQKMPHELSGGMARRVALARSLAIDPQLMLYDEPFTGQDPIGMQALLQLVKHCHQHLGMTSILVSHDVAEVCQIADHVILFEAGKILAQGSPSELQSARDEKVAQFMRGKLQGEMSFHYPAGDYYKELLDDCLDS